MQQHPTLLISVASFFVLALALWARSMRRMIWISGVELSKDIKTLEELRIALRETMTPDSADVWIRVNILKILAGFEATSPLWPDIVNNLPGAVRSVKRALLVKGYTDAGCNPLDVERFLDSQDSQLPPTTPKLPPPDPNNPSQNQDPTNEKSEPPPGNL